MVYCWGVSMRLSAWCLHKVAGWRWLPLWLSLHGCLGGMPIAEEEGDRRMVPLESLIALKPDSGILRPGQEA